MALAAAAGARADGRELSTRLVPAAQSASGLLQRYTAEQVALRNYVTSAKLTGLAPFRQAAAQIPAVQAQLARLVAGYRSMPATLAAAEAAQRAWLAKVAEPQLAAMRGGDGFYAVRCSRSPTRRPSRPARSRRPPRPPRAKPSWSPRTRTAWPG